MEPRACLAPATRALFFPVNSSLPADRQWPCGNQPHSGKTLRDLARAVAGTIVDHYDLDATPGLGGQRIPDRLRGYSLVPGGNDNGDLEGCKLEAARLEMNHPSVFRYYSGVRRTYLVAPLATPSDHWIGLPPALDATAAAILRASVPTGPGFHGPGFRPQSHAEPVPWASGGAKFLGELFARLHRRDSLHGANAARLKDKGVVVLGVSIDVG